MTNSSVRGVLVAVTTPWDRMGKLDLSLYQKQLEWLIESRVDGFVVGGTTGEGPTLSLEERASLYQITHQIIQRVRASSQKKITFVVGCGSNDTASVLGLIQQGASYGADAALVVTPYYNRPTSEGVMAHYQYLARKMICLA